MSNPQIIAMTDKEANDDCDSYSKISVLIFPSLELATP